MSTTGTTITAPAGLAAAREAASRPNIYEEAARGRKAAGLLHALVTLDADRGLGLDAATLAHLDTDGWSALAELAGHRAPSIATIGMVVKAFDRAKASHARPIDPFEGL